jgi:large subunit ribosomal protein L9
MKLILTQEVSGVGAPGDVVEVKDGYGRNYLVPRGLAVAWTKGGEKQVASIRKARSSREIKSLEEAQQVRAALESKKVTLTARAGANGRLFGAITTGDVAEALVSVGGPKVDRRKVELHSRSRPWATTPCTSGCTRTCRRRSPCRSSPADLDGSSRSATASVVTPFQGVTTGRRGSANPRRLPASHPPITSR